MTTIRDRMAEHIVKVEGRFDRQGRLTIYKLPAGDGGGTYEVAGINDRYHPKEARALRDLINSGQHKRAEAEAGKHIMKYTDPVRTWFLEGEKKEHRPVELILRDTFFNRGQKGAAATLQLALGGLDVDAKVGKATKTAFADALAADAYALAKKLTAARATYERRRFPWKPNARNEKSKFWKGLANRWANSHKAAMALVA